MHHKIRLKDDPRIDATMFFPVEMIVVAHIKSAPIVELSLESTITVPGNDKAKFNYQSKNQKPVRSIEEFKSLYPSGDEFIVFKIFDKLKVKVDTTTEFPLDIECKILFTKEDGYEYQRLIDEFELKTKNELLLLAESDIIVISDNKPIILVALNESDDV